MEIEAIMAERIRLMNLLGWWEAGQFGRFNPAAGARVAALRLRVANLDARLEQLESAAMPHNPASPGFRSTTI